MPKGRAPGNAWVKGQSGNPNGRPKATIHIRDMCREKTPEAVAALMEALKNPGERVPAANTLIAYGYGRPPQTVNVRRINDWNDLSDEELQTLAAEADLQRAETRH